MKKKLFLALVALLAIGLMFMGCPAGDDDDGNKDNGGDPNTGGPGGENGGNEEDYGTNLVTEEAILAATGHGGTEVEKVSDGVYTVTGTVTAYSNWDNSVNDNRITLNIQADPDDANLFFAQANRYTITIEFPAGGVVPIEEYTDGFRIYLENTRATANTAQWGGTWSHEWPDEYNEIEGVGTMTINRDLSVDGDGDPDGSEVGDYQHLVLVLIFDDEFENEEYTFTISNVGVYGEEVSDDFLKEIPAIMDEAQYTKLDDATYVKDATAAALEVTAVWTDNRDSKYTYLWYSNTTNSNTGGTAIPTATNRTHVPLTDTVGITYYYVVISYPDDGTSCTSKAVKIEVTES